MLTKIKFFFEVTLFSNVCFCFSTFHKTNQNLVDGLIKQGVIKSDEVASVMRSVDRGDFVSSSMSYVDSPQPIGFHATISAPHMHAFALEYLKDHLKTGKKALDVGSGSGYLTVCIAKMMNTPGSVAYGIEHIPELVKTSLENIKNSSHKELLSEGRVVILEGDGRLGLKEFAPYDAIHVGAGADKFPQELLDQLAYGGRMLIPVGKFGEQEYLMIDKDKDGKIHKKTVLNVRYVPLTDKEKQLHGFYL